MWASGSRRPVASIIRTPRQRGNRLAPLAERSTRWRREYPSGSILHTFGGDRRECPSVRAPLTLGGERRNSLSAYATIPQPAAL